MYRSIRIPVRAKQSSSAQESVEDENEVNGERPMQDESKELQQPASSQPPAEDGASQSETRTRPEVSEETIDWRDRALRLQAEMENFRKRQQRLAQEQIAAEREHLLRGVLTTADNLERALAEAPQQDELRRGVELTYNALRQWLKQHGVERMTVKGETFDPAWHDAVTTVPRERYGVAPQTVVEEMEAGYRLDGRLLRPAKVVVAM